MAVQSAKAAFLITLLAISCVLPAQTTYSDAAFRTFITVSVNGSTVWAKATYLNITYFSKINTSALGEVYKKANASRNLGDLYGMGNFSSENFTAEVVPAANASLRFTFEGNNVTDAGGAEICNPKKTNADGVAECEILHFKDETGAVKSVEETKNCGYVAIRLDEMKLPEGKLQSSTQTAVICPKDNVALSAFGPAIYSEVGANLPFCFPAMLIAGLLIAAMYYSGRDPLSVFDITTPKLPKTQSFKVKMGTSPQMLRQVQRRYLMIKGQARRDAVREIARMAKAGGMSRGEISEAKKRMGRFYDELEAKVKKGLKNNDELEMRQKWAEIMREYTGGGGSRVDRSLAFSSSLLEAYVKAHQARESMNAARGKTSKGWWARNVSDKVVANLTNASIAFEASKTGRVLGRIPLVKHVVSTPTKILDVAVQYRGSRNALKGIRGELIGQVAYMLGQTGAGKPFYNAAKSLHVRRGGGETGFAKAYRKWTGRTFKSFEEKHNILTKRLVEYFKVENSIRQHYIDVHNRMFDEIAARIVESLPLRANSVKRLVESLRGLSSEQKARLLRSTSLEELFGKIKAKGTLNQTKEGEQLAKDISALLSRANVSVAEVDGLIARAKSASLPSDQKAGLEALLASVRKSVAVENSLQNILNGLHTAETQSEMLRRLAKATGSREFNGAISQFEAREKYLLENALAFLDRDVKSRSLNYYRIIDKDQLKSDIAEGMPIDKLRRKYGSILDQIIDVREVQAFRDALNDKAVEARLFAKFADEERRMKDWALSGKADRNLAIYGAVAKALGDSSLGKNPLELRISEELRRILTGRAIGLSGEDADAIIKDAAGNARFTGMDSLEQFFKKKAGGAAYGSVDDLVKLGIPRSAAEAFIAARNRQGNDPESVLKAIMPGILDFAREWAARQYAAIEIMHGGGNAGRYMASAKAALKDIENFGKIKTTLGYLGGEKAFYRWEMGYSDYKGVDTEALIFTARGWEKLFGFVVADRWAGTSRGEQVLHLMKSAREDYASTLDRYRALFNNLINPTSVFYDKNFADKWGSKEFKADAYDALIARGYTWQDKKNGLELLLSVDRKSVPMLEYDRRYMKQGETEIVKKAEFNGGKADIRDYAPLVARTMGSYYSTREVGFVVLIKQGDKWIYGDPFKAEGTKDRHYEADKQITMRTDIMKSLVGISDSMKAGQYDPTKANIRVISIKDFTAYAKEKGHSDIFGNVGGLDRARESLRASISYKPSMLLSEVLYGAYSDRMNRMNNWYAGQWQMRQALDRMQHILQDDGGMMGGSDRFKYNANYNENYCKGGGTAWREHRSMDAETRAAVENEIGKLSRGKTESWSDNAAAWGREWRSRIASGIIGEIGRAETDYYSAKLEVRALERLVAGSKGDERAHYSALLAEAVAMKDRMTGDYKRAKDEYLGLNRDIIGWTGSGGIYTPQRTMWNLGLAGLLLDSKYVQGTKDAFYQITESSVMRDPRVAIGATAPGWEYSYYVGYHTGQNVYERSRFWATNSLWEQQMRLQTDLAFTVHKWWNERISFFARYTAGYPAPVQSDMMYAPSYRERTWGSYIKTLLITVPFQPRTYTDYFRSRWQDAISFSGAGAAAAAYQSLGEAGANEEGRSWLRRFLDSRGLESSHYFSTPFRISSQQRYVDQVMAFDKFVNENQFKINVDVEGEGSVSLNEARDRLKQAAENMDGEGERLYKKAISDAIGKYVKLDDRRGRYIRDVFSGSDIQEDGSRNRFLDMYSVFHSNVFLPTIPGMMHASPLGNSEWHTYPQVARNVDNAEPGSKIYATKHYWEAGYDAQEGRITFRDRFSTREDAVAEAYRNDVPVLMHLMKMQQKEINYSPINTPSLIFASPIWAGIGRLAYKTAASKIPRLASLKSTVDETGWKDWIDWAPGYGIYERHVAKKEHPELANKEDEYEVRRRIYGVRAGRLADEGEKTAWFLKAMDWTARGIMNAVNSEKIESSPGIRKIKKKTEEEYIGAMLKRQG